MTGTHGGNQNSAVTTTSSGSTLSANSTATNTTSAAHRQNPRDNSGKKPVYHCDYCRDDITNEIHIKCAECKSFDLCLDCFASGFAVYPHLPTHAYRVIKHIAEPLYDCDWSADEELLLLDGIDQFGLGNWAEIATFVGTKSKLKCEAHYTERFLESPIAPLPNNSAPFPSTDAGSSSHHTGASGPGRSRSKPPRDPREIQRDKERELDNAKYRALQLHHKTLQRNSIGSLVGFNSHRREFEIEYENDAELLIADLDFRQTDLPWERDLKLRVLELYNSKLDQRDSRREFLISRGVLMKRQRRRTRDEKAVYAKLRPFARFLSQGEFEEFVQGNIAELRLRRRIEQLQTYRMNGLTTFSEGLTFDLDSRRNQIETAVSSYTAIPISTETEIGTAIENINTDTDTTKEGEDQDQDNNQDNNHKRRRVTLQCTNESGETSTTNTSTSSSSSSSTEIPISGIIDKTKSGFRLSHELPPLTGTTQRDAIAAFSSQIMAMDGVSLLSLAERELCQELLLAPQHYLVIKERLVREAIKHGACSQGRAKQLLRVDVTSSGKIVDFFVSHGWITTEPRPNFQQDKLHTEP